MGFCRHCGNIVTGTRCACGGPPVAPVVSFNRTETPGSQDRWFKTYVSSKRSPTKTSVRNAELERNSPLNGPAKKSDTIDTAPASTRRFPRPKSMLIAPSTILNSGITDHITHATSQASATRPPSPLKISTTISDAENDILPSFLPHEPSLSKVYGSVLQLKNTLTLHSCAICEVIFPPDATIYPNLSQSDKASFICRLCFTANGGSKGNCPACSRPVLALKAEGAFIQSGGNYWHKQCYNCAGCFKNIGDAPMVDLLGRPSCPDCFDNCLKRDHPATPKKNRAPSNNNSPSFSNPGGLNTSYGPGRKSRESSPALEELEQRLGLSKSRENSPIIHSGRSPSSPRKSARLSSSQSSSSSNQDVPRSQHPKSGSQDIFEVSSPRKYKSQNTFTKHSLSESSTRSDPYRENGVSKVSLACTHRTSIQSRNNDILSSRISPSALDSNSSIMTTSLKPQNNLFDSSNGTDTANNLQDSAPTSSICDKCGKPILRAREGGQFVTIPGADENSVPQVYHSDCFKCAVCDKAFKGSALFVASRIGPCHAQCIPPETLVIQTQKASSPKGLPDWVPTIPHDLPTWTSTKLNTAMFPPPVPLDKSQAPLPSLHSSSKPAFPRFGGQTSCPGCHKAVSLMERGVVSGPQGSKWHAACLVCGGKKETTRTGLLGRISRDDKKGEPGCGKKLDSAAKIDGEGGVWCRECLLLLGVGGSPQTSPLKSPISPLVGYQGKINPQFTGTTTLARQFTGIAGNDTILRQVTGGGLNPTRSISPTKQLGPISNGGLRPRPKSIIGHVRNAKSVDEVGLGRGMYLVRQMTGTGNPSASWGESLR